MLAWLSSSDPGQQRLRNVSYTLCPLPSPSLSCHLHVGPMCRLSSTSRHWSLPPSSDMVYRPAATAADVRTPPSECEGRILDDHYRSSPHGCRPSLPVATASMGARAPPRARGCRRPSLASLAAARVHGRRPKPMAVPWAALARPPAASLRAWGLPSLIRRGATPPAGGTGAAAPSTW
jgi:hypothetical protein